jgi:hypothetical protein
MLSLRQAEVGLEDALAAAEAARRATSEKQFEAEHKASMARLTAAERVAELTADIAMREKLITDGIWTGADAERARALIATRRLELTQATADSEKDQEAKRTAIVTLREKEKALAAATADEEARLADEAARTLAAKEASVQTSARAAYDKSVFAALGERIYDDPARQAAYEQQQRDDAQRDIDRQIAALEQRLMRNAQGGSRTGMRERPELESQIRTLRNRRANVDDYVFDPDYQDRLGRGMIGQREDAYRDPGATGRLEEQAKRQTSALESVDRRLRRAGFSA